MSSFEVTGGPFYHARALFNRSRWQPLREWVSMNLSRHNLKDHLVLVGPSGGWSLPQHSFFENFKTISVYDPDPLAKKIFRMRFGIQVQWHCEDFFLNDGSALLSRPAHCTYLFCNVLGQLGLVYKKNWPRTEAIFKTRLLNFFNSHHWLSYHDVYSMNGVAHHLIYQDLNDFLAKENPQGEIVDHMTKDFFLKSHEQLFGWQMSSKRVHLLGWQSSEAPQL